MGSIAAIYHAGNSLIDYLRGAYPDDLREEHACEFAFLGTGEVQSNAPNGTTLSLLLYAVSMNDHLRQAARPLGPLAGTTPLAVDLHLLLTVWADTARAEHTILGWALRQLSLTPTLDASLLDPRGAWQADDVIHLAPVELRVEEIARLWEAMDQPYRLSMPYVARVVRIDGGTTPDSLPVVARRLSYTTHPEGSRTP